MADVLETRECPHCGQTVSFEEGGCPACGHLEQPTRCARHPDRIAKGRCVVCGSPVCAECDRPATVHYLCPEHRAVDVIEGWAQVYTTGDDVEAQLIRENLHAEGIDAEIFSQKDRMLTVELGDLSPVRLLVPAYEFTRARAVLAQHMDDRGEVAFACPSCGESYEPAQTICDSCGVALPRPLA